MRKFGWLSAVCALAFAVSACGDDDRGSDPTIMLDAGMGDGAVGTTDGGGGDVDGGDPTACNVGTPCNPSRGCVEGVCEGERPSSLGGTLDPIRGYPEGETTEIDTVIFGGGYCTPAGIALESDPGACDLDTEGSCGDCAECVNLGTQMGQRVSMCLRTCEPSATENTCPNPDYNTCLLGAGLCFLGCQSDDECAVYREDTDGDGDIQAPPMGTMAVDRLVYDADANWTCNETTRRCNHDGTEGASAGDACEIDSDCEANGRCLSEIATEGDFEGGYCVKDGCELDGRDCAEGGVCQRRRVTGDSPAICVAGCQVGAEFDPEVGDVPIGAAAQNPDCREGYACVWGGELGPAEGSVEFPASSGACLPGNFNEVDTPNVGARCESDADCYSPFGAGQCNKGPEDPYGFCWVLDCGPLQRALEADPMDSTTLCGENTLCVGISDDIGACLQTCEGASDCAFPFACTEITMDGDRACLPGCSEDGDCRDGETCEGAGPMTAGECVASCETAADCETGFACSAAGECEFECADDTQCREGEVCDSVADRCTSENLCDTAAGCEAGQACVDADGDEETEGGICRNSCSDDAQCREGEACDSLTDTCQATCADATACEVPLACVDEDGDEETPSICTTMCTEDAECRTGASPAEVCSAAGECATSCTAATECPAGLGCVDDDADAETPSICTMCTMDEQCREGETCGDDGMCATAE